MYFSSIEIEWLATCAELVPSAGREDSTGKESLFSSSIEFA